MARMPFEIELTEEALRDFRSLDAHLRASVRKALEAHLRLKPTTVSKSRIKRLRDLRHPQFRLRVDDIRVYYDVEHSTVTILGIVSKSNSEDWLADNSTPSND